MANPMPFDGALAIDSQGHVWGWGLNALGDLCLSGLTELRPSELPLSGVTLATGARTHSLFDSGGKVYACGAGEYGVLGTGSTASSSAPVPVVGLPSAVRVTALTSSWEGSGALLDNGAYYNWGYNAAGQLGNGTTTNSDVPVQVALPEAVRDVFQGGSGAKNGQTVAILGDGSVWAWGSNDRGQLGNGTRVSSDVPRARRRAPRGDLRPGQLRRLCELRHRRLGPTVGLGGQQERAARDGEQHRRRHQTGQRRYSLDAGLIDRPERGGSPGQYPAFVMGNGLASEAIAGSAIPSGYHWNTYAASGMASVASSTAEALHLTGSSKGRES